MGRIAHAFVAPRAAGPATTLARGVRILLRVCAITGIAALAFHVAHGQFGVGGHGLDGFTDNWLYDAVIAGSAVSCLARGALVRQERLAWLMLGAALALDATGEVYYTLAFGDSANPPIPSLADLFYLAVLPRRLCRTGAPGPRPDRAIQREHLARRCHRRDDIRGADRRAGV